MFLAQPDKESETIPFTNNSPENHFQYWLLSNDMGILAGINYIIYLFTLLICMEILYLSV